MAVARNGSVIVLNTNALLNVSTSGLHETPTIPGSSTLALLWWPGFYTETTPLTVPVNAPSLGGTAPGGGTVFTLIGGASRDDGSGLMGALWWMLNPPSGSQELHWDFGGTANADTGVPALLVCYTGSHASSPIGAVGVAEAAATPGTVSGLGNASGDLVVGFSGFFSSGAPTSSWTAPLTQVTAQTEKFDSWASYAEAAGTGSPITVEGAWASGDDGIVSGVVIKQAAGGGGGGGGPTLPWLPHITNLQGDKGALMIPSGFMPPSKV